MFRKLNIALVVLAVIFLPAAFDVSAQAKRKPAVKRPRGSVTVTAIIAATPEQKRRLESFQTVWQTIKDNYFDQTFNGLNWDRIKKEYEAKTLKAVSDSQFHTILQEMINRLNRSHFLI